MALESIGLPGAVLALGRAWLPAAEADALFIELLESVPWEIHVIRLFGRDIPSPRLSCWIGDPGTSYRYSGHLHQPRPWPDCLRPVRARLGTELGVGFNSVLANLYRDGNDAMGWHRDNERELGEEPVIASLSLGASRRFALKPIAMRGLATSGSNPATRRDADPGRCTGVALELGHGSLLVMRGSTQRHYRHALPRTRKPIGPRINLTFRQVLR